MKKYDLILFLGQSNMQGQSMEDLPLDVDLRAFEYKFLTDEIRPLTHSVGENITYDFTGGDGNLEDQQAWLDRHVVGSSINRSLNMVPSFMNSYTSIRNRKAIAVHIAKGSTAISYWLKGKPGYEAIRKKALAAIDHIGRDNIDNISAVWLQGESDAIENTSKNDYIDRLVRLKSNLKSDIGIDIFGIIKVGRFTLDERDEVILNAQEETVKLDNDFLMLTRITEKLLKEPDRYTKIYGHYNAIGQMTIGRIAGTNLASYFEQKCFIEDEI